jgi:ankyrin repeat protein
MLAPDDPLIASLTQLIQRGDVDGLATLLAQHPSLARDRIGDAAESRTVLHLATDWPGHLPRIGETINLLAAAGAPVDGRFAGRHEETPLHWAASCDDIAALDALLDAGADIEADGAVLTGGTPLSDAVVFAQWNAARRLVEHGAAMTLWQAAAVGDEAEVVRLLSPSDVTGEDIANACWHACRAGSLPTARILVAAGADLDRVGHDRLTPRQAGLSSGHDDLIAWLGGS